MHMRGYVFTITTFLIFLGIISYFSSFVNIAKDRAAVVNDQIAAERTWRSWLSTASGVSNLANVSFTKAYGVAEISDTLPATRNVSRLLNQWQNFTRTFNNDLSMASRFQDSSGNEILLGDNSLSKINIVGQYVNINYSWPDWKKNSTQITASGSQMAYIDRIDLSIQVTPNIRKVSDIAWVPDFNSRYNTTCNSTTQAHCLRLNLTVTDGTNTWNSNGMSIDTDRLTSVKIDLDNNGDKWLNVTIGKLNNLLNVDMKAANANVNTQIVLNTNDFYTNFLARLNVSSPFSQKVTGVGLSVWKNRN